MNKIKNIKISDFRIYEGTEEFSFERNGVISNLIALYAPNGYGKTSFFDALEWGFSNEIKRFENKLVLEAFKEDEDSIVLTNTYSHHSGVKGKVKIVIDNDKYFEKIVDPRKKTNKNFYFDYRAGIIKGDLFIPEFVKFPETNILTQDQIDSFLRYKSPEEKFDALKEFWPQGGAATKRYHQLSEYTKAVDNRIDEANSETVSLKKNLHLYVSSDDNIIKINSWIEKLNSNPTQDYNLNRIGKDISGLEYDSILGECNSYKKQLSLKIDSLKSNQADLSSLLTDFNLYVKYKLEIVDHNNKIVNLQEKQKAYIDLKEKQKALESYSIEIKQLDKKIKDFEFVSLKNEKYFSDLESITQLRTNQKVLLQEISILFDDIAIWKNSISNFERRKLECTEILEEKIKTQLNADARYAEYIEFTTEEKEKKAKLEDLELKLKNSQSDINTFQRVQRELRSILEVQDFQHPVLFENDGFNSLIVKFNLVSQEEADLRSGLELKIEKLEKSGSLNENLNRIISWGEEYVQETKTTNCPLCKSKFSSLDELITNIKSEKIDVLKISKIEDEIKVAKTKLEEKINEKAELIYQIKTAIGKKLENISELLTKCQKENDEQKNQVNELRNRMNFLDKEKLILLNFFKSFSSENDRIDEQQLMRIKKSLQLDIDVLTEREERLIHFLTEKTNRLIVKEDIVLLKDSIITKNKNGIAIIESQEDFVRISNIIADYGIENNLLSPQLVKDNLTFYEKQKGEKENLLKSQRGEIILIEKAITESKYSFDDTLLEGELSAVESQLSAVSALLKKYENSYRKTLTKDDFKEETIITELDICNKKILQYLEAEETLNNLGIDLELIKENIEKNRIEKRLVELQEELPRLKRVKVKLDKAKASCMTFIREGINKYFNKDVINQIYKRIEPHPKLKEIDFKADIGNNGPRLLITAKGETDEVNPILYLSAGQVNVLSLSIFLAKAFELGSEKISTIFMDDPIQNLSDINVLSFIDLLRTLIAEYDKQIVISTHDEHFFRLLQNKLPENYCKTKYFEFESEGKLKRSAS